MDEYKELNEKLVAKGLLPVQTLIDNPEGGLGKYATLPGINNLDDFRWFLETKHKEYCLLRALMEVDGAEDNELYEWALAHNAAFSTVLSHFNKVMRQPDVPSDEVKK
jgi:hypothetical protein